MMSPIPTKKLKSGEEIPSIGLGTWLIGGDAQKSPSPQDAVDVSVLRHGIETGFSHIDTAEIYAAGYTEELVAQAIQGYDRDKLFIATKATQGNHSRDRLRASIDGSLKRLKIDTIDLYYLHRPTLETPFEETADILNQAYISGKIRHIGVCNFASSTLDRLQSFLKPKIIANQVHYNLSFREPETTGLLDHAKEKDYFVIAWRPLKLVRRNDPNSLVKSNIWDRGVFPLLDQMADKYARTNVQIALSWVLHEANVCTLVKSSNPHHLDEIRTGIVKLSDDDHAQLRAHFSPQFRVSDTIPLV